LNEPTCDANPQCKAVCQVKAALATNCAISPDAQVRLAGDPRLYGAIKNHLPEFAQLVVRTNLLNEKSLGISHVTLADYKALGATRDRVRVCVLQGVDATAQARASLSRAISASQIMRGISF